MIRDCLHQISRRRCRKEAQPTETGRKRAQRFPEQLEVVSINSLLELRKIPPKILPISSQFACLRTRYSARGGPVGWKRDSARFKSPWLCEAEAIFSALNKPVLSHVTHARRVYHSRPAPKPNRLPEDDDDIIEQVTQLAGRELPPDSGIVCLVRQKPSSAPSSTRRLPNIELREKLLRTLCRAH